MKQKKLFLWIAEAQSPGHGAIIVASGAIGIVDALKAHQSAGIILGSDPKYTKIGTPLGGFKRKFKDGEVIYVGR